MFDRRYLVPSSNASITIDVIEHCQNMYADDPTSLVDSTFILQAASACQLIVN